MKYESPTIYSTSTVRNSTHFVVQALHHIWNHGTSVNSRFGDTLELLDYHTTILQPRERLIYLPPFDSNPAAQIINGFWILTGSNDIAVLQKYLPEVQHRSDDDVTWRGGFGPRLRNWHGVDQLKHTVEILTKRPESRRASLTLFDPVFDFHESKDVSTANTIHCMVRENQLNMSVIMRSADVLGSSVPGGLAMNNLFEWSLLQEIIASATGYPVGYLHLHVHSLHMYRKDQDMAQAIIQTFNGMSMYERQHLITPQIQVKLEHLDAKLDSFFAIESRLLDYDLEKIPRVGEPYFDECLRFLWCIRHEKMSFVEDFGNMDFGIFFE